MGCDWIGLDGSHGMEWIGVGYDGIWYGFAGWTMPGAPWGHATWLIFGALDFHVTR